MKSALIISLGLHIAVGLIWFRLVKISQVRFVPRQVYTVSLVTPAEATKPRKENTTPPQPKPEVEEEPEEMAPPPEKPKPKPKPKPEKPKEVKKTIPSTEIKKIAEPQETAPSENTEVATGDIMLDGQDFPFAYYLASMKRKIAAFWKVPGTSPSEPRYCRVYFRVSRNGSIQSPAIETSSGNFLFDQAALRAVVQASPLPSLPGGFADDYLGVHFNFAYEQE